MLYTLLLGFISGFFLGNGLPYFIVGSFGKEHGFSFGKSAAANVMAGVTGFAIAGIAWHFADPHIVGTYIAALLGMACVGLIHTKTWQRITADQAE